MKPNITAQDLQQQQQQQQQQQLVQLGQQHAMSKKEAFFPPGFRNFLHFRNYDATTNFFFFFFVLFCSSLSFYL